MALIKCSKCGKEVSNKADCCVHCGNELRNRVNIFTVLIFFFLGILILIGLFFCFIFKGIGNYTNHEYINVVDYYDQLDKNKFICRIESKINVNKEFEIVYSSNVTQGECDYENTNLKGVFEFNFNNSSASFNYNNSIYNVDILFKDKYLCYDNCNVENRYYTNFEQQNVVKKYIKAVDTSNNNESVSGEYFTNFKDITYKEFMDLIQEGKAVVFIGSENCRFCLDYSKVLDQIMREQNITIFHLDIETLSEEEKANVFNNINIDKSIPILGFFDNGLKSKLIGLQTKEVTMKELQNNFFLNSFLA